MATYSDRRTAFARQLIATYSRVDPRIVDGDKQLTLVTALVDKFAAIPESSRLLFEFAQVKEWEIHETVVGHKDLNVGQWCIETLTMQIATTIIQWLTTNPVE